VGEVGGLVQSRLRALAAFVLRCVAAAVLAYLLAGAVGLPHPLWACIFALISSQDALPATLRTIGGRVVGTLIGVTTAVAAGLALAPIGLGLLAQIAASVALCALLAWRRPAIQLCLWTAPIVLMNAAPGQSIVAVGFDRGCEVVIGVLVGGLLNLAAERVAPWRPPRAPAPPPAEPPLPPGV
jgi:uncharacterized membrane protein YgaE (UPF0421/DUF939 family)